MPVAERNMMLLAKDPLEKLSRVRHLSLFERAPAPEPSVIRLGDKNVLVDNMELSSTPSPEEKPKVFIAHS